MMYHRRLTHERETTRPVFLTWCLFDSLPSHRTFPEGEVSSGRAFAIMDRLLDEADTGSFYLRQPLIEDMVVEAMHYNASALGQYELHAFVVMPNHVHLLITPRIELPRITKSLKGITAKRANEMLWLTGTKFWQEESYDHTVRNEQSFGRIWSYIEMNPVRAGLVRRPEEYRWSSAGWASGV